VKTLLIPKGRSCHLMLYDSRAGAKFGLSRGGQFQILKSIQVIRIYSGIICSFPSYLELEFIRPNSDTTDTTFFVVLASQLQEVKDQTGEQLLSSDKNNRQSLIELRVYDLVLLYEELHDVSRIPAVTCQRLPLSRVDRFQLAPKHAYGLNEF
jgi:hypothetical protein